jgi:hypothetical protein
MIVFEEQVQVENNQHLLAREKAMKILFQNFRNMIYQYLVILLLSFLLQF